MRPRDAIIWEIVEAVVKEAKFIALANGPSVWWPDEAVRIQELVRKGVFQEINSFQQELLRKANQPL